MKWYVKVTDSEVVPGMTTVSVQSRGHAVVVFIAAVDAKGESYRIRCTDLGAESPVKFIEEAEAIVAALVAKRKARA